jgi:hypothetical protein
MDRSASVDRIEDPSSFFFFFSVSPIASPSSYVIRSPHHLPFLPFESLIVIFYVLGDRNALSLSLSLSVFSTFLFVVVLRFSLFLFFFSLLLRIDTIFAI